MLHNHSASNDCIILDFILFDWYECSFIYLQFQILVIALINNCKNIQAEERPLGQPKVPHCHEIVMTLHTHDR